MTWLIFLIANTYKGRNWLRSLVYFTNKLSTFLAFAGFDIQLKTISSTLNYTKIMNEVHTNGPQLKSHSEFIDT